jgi:hypothetical protein
VYCPEGSHAPTTAAAGYYTAPAVGASTNLTNGSFMARAFDCPSGSYCLAGEERLCPAGRYQRDLRASSEGSCRACVDAGFFCRIGTASPLMCGGDDVFCPAGASEPVRAPAGQFTEGPPGARTVATVCSIGYYCPGDGLAFQCPAGRYGNASGLLNDSCSGVCGDGTLCRAGTATAYGQPCPVGHYCLRGLALPCPSGTYGPVEGAAGIGQCEPCRAGAYNPRNGSSSDLDCLPCPEFEGSDAGAAACWPGIMGRLPLSRTTRISFPRGLVLTPLRACLIKHGTITATHVSLASSCRASQQS